MLHLGRKMTSLRRGSSVFQELQVIAEHRPRDNLAGARRQQPLETGREEQHIPCPVREVHLQAKWSKMLSCPTEFFFFFGTWKMMACLPSQYASASYLRNCVVTWLLLCLFSKSCCGWEEHWKCLTDVSRQLYWVRSLALWCSPARVTGAQRGESLATHWHSTDTFWILCKPPHVWDLALFAGCYLLQSGEEEISTNTSWNKFFS